MNAGNVNLTTGHVSSQQILAVGIRSTLALHKRNPPLHPINSTCRSFLILTGAGYRNRTDLPVSLIRRNNNTGGNEVMLMESRRPNPGP